MTLILITRRRKTPQMILAEQILLNHEFIQKARKHGTETPAMDFGEGGHSRHDVSGESRDKDGKWTAGAGGKHHVSFKDTDSGEDMGTTHIFPDIESARAHAKKITHNDQPAPTPEPKEPPKDAEAKLADVPWIKHLGGIDAARKALTKFPGASGDDLKKNLAAQAGLKPEEVDSILSKPSATGESGYTVKDVKTPYDPEPEPSHEEIKSDKPGGLTAKIGKNTKGAYNISYRDDEGNLLGPIHIAPTIESARKMARKELGVPEPGANGEEKEEGKPRAEKPSKPVPNPTPKKGATLAFVPDKEGGSGWLCVKNTDGYGHDTPKMIVDYWPITRGSLSSFQRAFPEVNTDTPLRNTGGHEYELQREWGSTPPPLFRLTDGGSTKSIKREIVPIPCPKVASGIETRFNRGRWEKYLKTKGWTPA